MKNKILLAVLILTSAVVPKANAQLTFKFSDSSPFAFNWIADAAFVTAGASTTAVSFYLEHNNNFPSWDGNLADINKVNSFDRWAARPFNKTLHVTGTVTTGAELLLTPVLIAGEAFFGSLPKQEILPAATMFIESFLLSYGTKDLLKRTALRYRPYMYFEGYPEDKVADGDFQYSWPSGHTTNAFLGATFTCCMMNYYFPDSKWRLPVNICALSVAAATGILRVLSGNHFITDVLTGAAIGSLCGFIVPFVHHKMAQSINTRNGKIQNIALNLLPAGLCVSFNF